MDEIDAALDFKNVRPSPAVRAHTELQPPTQRARCRARARPPRLPPLSMRVSTHTCCAPRPPFHPQVSIVANYIKERTKDAQFIIISLRNNMFELADRLVGIYKTRDVTKSVTINPKAIAAECGVPSGQEAYDRRGGASTTTGVVMAGAPLGDRSNAT